MSRPIALPSPLARARRPAPTAPPAGPERTLQAPARAASAAGATPPEDCITSGAGSPPSAAASLEPAQVAAEQRREVGVDRGGRAALVLPEAGQDLVRGGDVDAGKLAPQMLGEPALMRGVEVGEEQADGDRLGAALADRLRQPRRLAVVERLDHALRADPLRRLEAQLAARPAAPAWARRAGRAGGGPGGRSRAGRRSRAVAISAVRAPAFLEQGVGADRHPVGEDLDAPAAAPAARSTVLDRGDHPQRLVLRAWSARFAVWIRSPSTGRRR